MGVNGWGKPDDGPRAPSRRRVPRWVLVAGSTLILAVAAWRILLPQYSMSIDALGDIEHLSTTLILLAVALEMASLLAYSVLTASVLGPKRPPFFAVFRIDLANLAVSHSLPGGGATAAAVRYRLLQQVGVPRTGALSAVAIEITGSNLVLLGLFATGLVLSLSTVSANTMYRTVAVGSIVVLAAVGIGIWALARHTEAVIRLARGLASHVPLVSGDFIASFLATLTRQVVRLLKNPREMARDFSLAAANWLLDTAALWVFVAAFGHHLGLGQLLTVYSLGSILGVLPLTPGGLGIVEGVMVPALVGFGTPPEVALLGVLGWRLVQFWMPIPLGAVAYASLWLGPLKGRR